MPAARTTAAAQPAAAAATAPPADQRSRSMRQQRRRMIDDPTARPDRRRIGGECTALLSRARCATDRSPGRWPVRRPVRHSPVSDERERESCRQHTPEFMRKPKRLRSPSASGRRCAVVRLGRPHCPRKWPESPTIRSPRRPAPG